MQIWGQQTSGQEDDYAADEQEGQEERWGQPVKRLQGQEAVSTWSSLGKS